jgi:hypothetical protein
MWSLVSIMSDCGGRFKGSGTRVSGPRNTEELAAQEAIFPADQCLPSDRRRPGEALVYTGQPNRPRGREIGIAFAMLWSWKLRCGRSVPSISRTYLSLRSSRLCSPERPATQAGPVGHLRSHHPGRYGVYPVGTQVAVRALECSVYGCPSPLVHSL